MPAPPTATDSTSDVAGAWHQRLVLPCGVTLYQGDCLEILPEIEADAVISDPPYGMDWDTDHTRFQTGPNGDGPGRLSKQKHERIINDAEPFDPEPWLSWEKVVLCVPNEAFHP